MKNQPTIISPNIQFFISSLGQYFCTQLNFHLPKFRFIFKYPYRQTKRPTTMAKDNNVYHHCFIYLIRGNQEWNENEIIKEIYHQKSRKWKKIIAFFSLIFVFEQQNNDKVDNIIFWLLYCAKKNDDHHHHWYNRNDFERTPGQCLFFNIFISSDKQVWYHPTNNNKKQDDIIVNVGHNLYWLCQAKNQ